MKNCITKLSKISTNKKVVYHISTHAICLVQYVCKVYTPSGINNTEALAIGKTKKKQNWHIHTSSKCFELWEICRKPAILF